MTEQTRYNLNETDLPKQWYNVLADSPVPPQPVLHPGTLQPVTPDFLSVLFPMEIIQQEITRERYIPIPEEVREIYQLYRPTPLIRARRLEKLLDTPAHIYYKNEGVSPVGSHKANTAIPQAYFNKISGVKALTTETGAGQWGTALSMAGHFFDIDVEVYMVNVSYHQKPYRRIFMEMYGATVYPSPTTLTQCGRALLEKYPDHPGSLGVAISEAVEVAAMSGGTKKYSLGSVLNHVFLHQSVIGEESLKQMDMAGEYPDVVIGCVGGGSNFAGIAFPFLRENLTHGQRTRLVAVEPTATPSLTKGLYAFDYGDTAKMAPVVKMYTLGHTFIPAGIHAGGLRYHGMGPAVSALYNAGYIEAVAVNQLSTFEAAKQFTQTEGIIPAPESAHAVRTAIDEALDAKAKGEKRVILFNLSGHGHYDMTSYEKYMQGALEDFQYPLEAINAAKSDLPVVNF